MRGMYAATLIHRYNGNIPVFSLLLVFLQDTALLVVPVPLVAHSSARLERVLPPSLPLFYMHIRIVIAFTRVKL